ncbi:hypothetical protein LOK49_LG10G01877 [Camellia lanceoleosa]|uniref:Uncharacterized protein n=1 Tax=Camellia lanceoleosa TaxID=1840588 RepID=A0ACC0GCJ5_9ERIC|nr:hypothetical protein LOK49_LG10G01877 [Camellia lanceoleosa]
MAELRQSDGRPECRGLCVCVSPSLSLSPLPLPLPLLLPPASSPCVF